MDKKRKSSHRISGVKLSGETRIHLPTIPVRPGITVQSKPFKEAVAKFCPDGIDFDLNSSIPHDHEPLSVHMNDETHGVTYGLKPEFKDAVFATSECESLQLASLAVAWIAWAMRLFLQADVHYDAICPEVNLWRNVGSPNFHFPTPVQLKPADVNKLGAFLEALPPITPVFSSDKRLDRAMRFFDRAYEASDPVEVVFFLVASVDALLSPSGSEASWRISQRLARLVGQSEEDALRIVRLCKLSYSLRSKVAHGTAVGMSFHKTDLRKYLELRPNVEGPPELTVLEDTWWAVRAAHIRVAHLRASGVKYTSLCESLDHPWPQELPPLPPGLCGLRQSPSVV